MPQRRYAQAFPIPLAGLDDREGETRDPNFASDVRNMRFLRERAVKGPGSVLFGSGVAGGRIVSFSQMPRTAQDDTAYLRASRLDIQYLHDTNPAAGWQPIPSLIFATPAGMRMSMVVTQDRLLFSDGTLNIQAWDGNDTHAPVQAVAMASPSLVVFNNRVIAVRTLDASGVHNTRVQWCVSGNVMDWAGLGSGFLEAIDNDDHSVTTGFRLGTQCMLAKKNSLFELVPTGNVDSPFAFASPRGGGAYVSGTGCPFPHTPAVAEYFVFFCGMEDVYMWDGSSLKSMGADRIVRTLMNILPYNSPYSPQGVVNTADEEYWLLLSETAEGGVLIYDYRHDRWYRDDWPNISAVGRFISTALLVTNIGDIDRTTMTMVGFADTHTCDRIDQRISTRHNTEITGWVSTADFIAQLPLRQGHQPTLSQRNVLWRYRVETQAATTVGLAYSVDKGQTWNELIVAPNVNGIATRDVIQNFIRTRFRIKSTQGPLSLFRAGEYQWSTGGFEL